MKANGFMANAKDTADRHSLIIASMRASGKQTRSMERGK